MADGRHHLPPERPASSTPTSTVGPDTVIEPFVQLLGQTRDRQRLPHPLLLGHPELHHRRSASCPHGCILDDAQVDDGAQHRPLRASAPGQPYRRRRARRQLRRDQEDPSRQRLQGQPSHLSRRRGNRQQASTSAPAPSPAITMASRSTRPSSATGSSLAATPRWSRPSSSAREPTSAPARASPKTFPPTRWPWPRSPGHERGLGEESSRATRSAQIGIQRTENRGRELTGLRQPGGRNHASQPARHVAASWPSARCAARQTGSC